MHWNVCYSTNKKSYEKLKVYNQRGGDTWECPACTFINKSDVMNCEMCGTPRPPLPSPQQVKIHVKPVEKQYPNEKYLLRIDNVSVEIENKKIPGVGNCLFDALIESFKTLRIHENIRSSQDFRDMIFDYVTKNKDTLISKHGFFKDYLEDLLKNIKNDRNFVFQSFDYVVPIIHHMLRLCIKVLKPVNPIENVYEYVKRPFEIDAIEQTYISPCECTTHTISLFNLVTKDGAGNINNGHYDLVLTKKNISDNAFYENKQYSERRNQNKNMCK